MIWQLQILFEQKHPVKFLLSRLLRDSGLCRFIKIHRRGYLLHLHPASLPMSLWVNPNDRNSDSDVLRAILQPGDVYVDVGANIGHLAIEAALIVGNTGSVTAFEAHPRTAEFLRQNILLNKLANVRVAQAAVCEKFGWIGFTNERSDDQNSVSEHGEISVPMVTLDELLADTSPTLLKIDVEGFEKFVLLGANSLLERTQFVYFEAWDDHFKKYGYSFLDIFDLLFGKNFQIVTFTSSTTLKQVTRDASIQSCVNLLAYRDYTAIAKRTGWMLE